ncbi:MAG: hypothetical protein WCI57_04935 [Candidatus Berkelbacteria bacterium]
MILNNNTFKKVTSLLGGKYENATYNGCAMFTGNVCFLLFNEKDNQITCGVQVELTQDFVIKKVSRMGAIQSTNMRNKPTERIQYPIYKSN